MCQYEFVVLGEYSNEQLRLLKDKILSVTKDFYLEESTHLKFLESDNFEINEELINFVAVYFNGENHPDIEKAHEIVRKKLPIIPVFHSDVEIESQIPEFLRGVLGLKLNNNMQELAAAMLECVGLLRNQRKVFISYVRNESHDVAIQLQQQISERKFDVFLDTQAIRYGENIEEIILHRMMDSDIMVMLDTQCYSSKFWTMKEYNAARSRHIHFLRIVWPGNASNLTQFPGQTFKLVENELEGANNVRIIDTKIDEILSTLENLRSKSIAMRYKKITNSIKSQIEMIGGVVEGVGKNFSMPVNLNGVRKLLYPRFGIPDAKSMFNILNANSFEVQEVPIMVYDHCGISEDWVSHLVWLNEQIAEIDVSKINDLAALLQLGEEK